MQELNVKYLNYDHHSHTIGVVLLELGSYVLNLIVTANLHIKVKGVATARFGGPNQTLFKFKKKKGRKKDIAQSFSIILKVKELSRGRSFFFKTSMYEDYQLLKMQIERIISGYLSNRK